MGNYYSYETKERPNLEIPKIYFEDINSLECLLSQGYTHSKRWDMVKDMSRLSSGYPLIDFEVIVTEEDSDKIRKVIFKNGKVVVLLGKVVFPEYSNQHFQSINLDSKENWNLNSIKILK